MAIYHLSVKAISRSAGRSATAAAAYRAGARIEDERTGDVHDYSRKQGVEGKMLVLPAERPEWASERSKLWNKAEGAESRKNSTVAREIVVALPAELTPAQRKQLVGEFAQEIVNFHLCAADVAIHSPSTQGDDRNHHAHILLTTRRMTRAGFTEKTRELDDKKSGPMYVKIWRERFAALQNSHLRDAGQTARVDHRTLEQQGIERVPTKHLGIHATAIERRTGQPSRRRIAQTQEATSSLALGKAIRETERSIAGLQEELVDQVEARKAQSDKEQQQALYKSRADAMRSNESDETVLKRHPELAGAFAALHAIELQTMKDGLSAEQRAFVMQQARQLGADSIEKGHLPRAQVRDQKQEERREERGRDFDR